MFLIKIDSLYDNLLKKRVKTLSILNKLENKIQSESYEGNLSLIEDDIYILEGLIMELDGKLEYLDYIINYTIVLFVIFNNSFKK